MYPRMARRPVTDILSWRKILRWWPATVARVRNCLENGILPIRNASETNRATVAGHHRTTLVPDYLLRRGGEPRVVLDAKWKAAGPTPDAADLHQILAYAAITGARRVGLVYPGRRFACREVVIPGRDIRLSLLRVRVVGTTEECRDSVGRLTRLVCRKWPENPL